MQTEQDWQDRVQSTWSAANTRFTSMVDQYRNGSGASTPWNLVLASAIIGLLLGLFVGWVVWPVEWQGARISHLDADARAQYVAAVADAFVATGGTDTARDLALRRLEGLEVSDAILNAQRYFIANSRATTGIDLTEAELMLIEGDGYAQRLAGDTNIRLSNLNQLATGLGVESFIAADLPVDQTTTGAVGAPGGDIQPVETAATAVDSTAPESAAPVNSAAMVEDTADAESGMSIVSILLGGLAALLLIAGGLWVLYRLIQQGGEETTQPAAAATTQRSYADDALEQVAMGAYATDEVNQYRNPASGQGRTRSDEIGGFSFATSDEIEPFAPEDIPEGTQEWSSSRPGVETQQIAGAGAHLYTESVQTEDETYTQQALQNDEAIDDTGFDEWTDAFGEDSTVLAPPPDAPLDEFTAHYDADMQPPYEERRNIIASTPDGGEISLGEYGLAVNIKNGVRTEDPRDVIALDLWLFDKSDTSNPKNRTQIFLSDYAVESGLANSIQGERKDDPEPIMPQPGDRYQLHGVDLTLDCQVLDVEYVTDGDGQGAFANFEVHLSVYQPAG